MLEQSTLAFLANGGATGALIRAYPWASSPLGSPEHWPQSLKTLTGLMLASVQPMFIIWGPNRIWLQNDAMTPLMGKKHPAAIGKHALDEVWSEARDALAPLFASVFAGSPVQMDDIVLELDRHGRPQEAHFAFSYNPVRSESGEVSGLFGVCIDTTARIMAERQAELEAHRFQQLFEQSPAFMAVLRGPEHRFEYANPGYYTLIQGREVIGRTVAEALPEAAAQGFVQLLDTVYRSGEVYNARSTKYTDTQGNERYLDFVYQPIRNARGDIDGILVEGIDTTDRTRAELIGTTLARLTEELRDLESIADISYAAGQVIGEALGVSRVGYGTVDVRDDSFTVERDWNAPGVESIAGVLNLRDFGTFVDDLKAGKFVSIANVRLDPRTSNPAASAALEGRSAASFVNVAVIENSQAVAVLYVNNATPRQWSRDDLDLIREVAARTRTNVERARTTIALRESERRYRALFDSVDEGFCIIEFIDGPDGPMSDYVHIEANPAYAVHAGIPNVVGQKVRQMVGAEAQGWIDLYAGVLRTGEPIRFERELEATGRWLELAAFRIEPVGRRQVAVLFRDLTARKQAEEAVRTSEANFRTLALAMPNQAWTARPDGFLDWFNDQVYIYGGAEPGSIDGTGWTRYVHPDDLPAASARWAEALRVGDTYQTEFRLRAADGSYRWHIGRAVPLKDPDGAIVRWVGTNTDIHDQKAAAEALADLNATLEVRVQERTDQLMAAEEALRQSQKMEAVGQLTGGIAHDFNNLLQGISGSLELLSKRFAEGRTTGVERYLAASKEATQRAAALTQRLLAFSRRQTLDPKPTDVGKLIAGMEDLIRRSVGPDVVVEVVHAGGVWPTKIDAPQLENALLNLCINGRDAMAPDGGRLTIETANKWLDERAARDRDLPPGQYVSVSVTDTGTGMPQDVIERAFDPFFTTKPLGQGTGLGLSMVYGFVRQSGGQIRIYSEVGMGTTMTLYLPRYVGEIDVVGRGPAAEGMERGDGETVLIVDDEPIIRMLMLDTLQDAGYRALEAKDGPSALKILESSARIDLLITDVGLPGGMNGRQVADAARRTRPNLKVLFVTGYAENAVIGNGHLAPGMEVVTKPFEIAALGQRVRNLLERA